MAWLVVQLWSASRPADRLLLISKRTVQQDSPLVDLSASIPEGTFTYVPAGSPFGRDMLAYVKAPPKADLVLVRDHGGSLRTESDLSQIQKDLLAATVDRRTAERWLYIGAPLAILWMGLLLRVARVAPVLLVVVAVSMAGKLTTLCVICGEAEGVPFWMTTGALVGSVVALVGGQLPDRRLSCVLVRGVVATLALGQLGLLFGDPSLSCRPCVVSWIALGSLAVSQGWVAEAPEAWRRTPLKLVGAGVGVVAFLVLGNPRLLASSGKAPLRAPKDGARSLVGTNAFSGPLRLFASPNPKAELVCLSRETCEPCNKAKAYFRRNDGLRVRFVECDPASESRTKTPDRVVPSPGLPLRTPTFLVVAKDGTILSQISGWADYSDWTQAATQTLKASLRLAQTGEKP